MKNGEPKGKQKERIDHDTSCFVSQREQHVGLNFRLTRPRTILAVYNTFGSLTSVAAFELFNGIIYELSGRRDRKYIKFTRLRSAANRWLI